VTTPADLLSAVALYALAVIGADRLLAWACERGVTALHWWLIRREMERTRARINMNERNRP